MSYSRLEQTSNSLPQISAAGGRNKVDFIAYYEEIAKLQGLDPQQSARTRDANGTIPEQARELLFNVAGEIKNTFHEFGAPLPPLLEGCTVLDLCCGSGRDTYLAAQLVGAEGKVIGVEPVSARLRIAKKYLSKEMKQFGYAEPNVSFLNAAPENLSEIEDASVDVVISNCTFNLSPDKEAYVREVFRVLKPEGEWYFTDVFTARRMPEDLASQMPSRAERLAGAMYAGDFRRLVQTNGLMDPRYLMNWKTSLSDEETAKYGDVEFATLTVRVLKSAWTEDVCESYGETVIYDGSLPDYPDYFLFEHNIKFGTGEPRVICGNVSALARHSRYAKVFEVQGDRSTHIGDTHHAFDALIVNAPDFDGVLDEDDQPIMISCC